jgi:drug/metabolite transporter (DMT)-like permease
VIPILAIGTIIVLLAQQEGAIFVRAGILLLVGLVLYVVNYLVKRGLDRGTPQQPDQ